VFFNLQTKLAVHNYIHEANFGESLVQVNLENSFPYGLLSTSLKYAGFLLSLPTSASFPL